MTKKKETTSNRIDLSTLTLNETNPRLLTEGAFEKLKNSITTFERMMSIRPIVVDENNVILGGNQRFRALLALGYNDVPAEWVIRVDDLTEDQKKEFVIKDNVPLGQWDFDMLANEWNIEDLESWGVDLPKIGEGDAGDDLSDTIEMSYRVEITVKDEDAQNRLYNEMIERGFECRLLTL